MQRGYLDAEDDIVALATPSGEGALAVLRLAGPGTITRLAGAFSRPGALAACAGYAAVYGRLLGPGGEPVDEVVALVFRAPKSYTGQDGVDLMCHGGMASAERALAALAAAGFKQALPGEFSFRAYRAGKLDLVRARAVDELVRARTVDAHEDALKRLSGELSAELSDLRAELLRLAAACALRLDYGEDESPDDFAAELPAIRALAARCRALADSYRVGRLLKEGAVVALAGKTNAGKSSLFNRLLKEERAIVSPHHGTTRDYLEAELDLRGVPVRLVDTAGLRDAADPVEAEGVRRSRLLAEGADALIYLVDAARGLDAEDEAFIAAYPGALRVWNKVDLPGALPPPAGWIAVSALDGRGESELAAALAATLMGGDAAGATPGAVGRSAVRLSTAAQCDALLAASASLDEAAEAFGAGLPLDALALDLAAAQAELAGLLGEASGEDVLDALFANFCVGK